MPLPNSITSPQPSTPQGGTEKSPARRGGLSKCHPTLDPIPLLFLQGLMILEGIVFSGNHGILCVTKTPE